MEALRHWGDAGAFVLSCPGPLRRHSASLLPVGELSLPQVLLGGEAQLLAFVAAVPELAGRCFFAPLPEMFASDESLDDAWRRCGAGAHPPRLLVHLRFGSTRMARVLKSARNGAVVAERHGAGPITASHHPFASGLVLPAAMRRVFVYGPEETRPTGVGGEALPSVVLPPECLTADLVAASSEVLTEALPRDALFDAGLDVVAFGDFRSGAWAAGPMRGRVAQLRGALREARTGVPFVLLPWNMDHPGSIVPELLARLVRLQNPASPLLRVLVMPFNYLGQTGIIRRLIAEMRDAAGGDDRVLGHLFIGRLSRLSALRQLRQISSVAWVDGNDPEHAWTVARLAAVGLRPILLGAPDADASSVPCLPCDETIRIEAETRYGVLSFPAHIPSLRAMPALLALSEMAAGPGLRRGVRRARRQGPA